MLQAFMYRNSSRKCSKMSFLKTLWGILSRFFATVSVQFLGKLLKKKPWKNICNNSFKNLWKNLRRYFWWNRRTNYWKNSWKNFCRIFKDFFRGIKKKSVARSLWTNPLLQFLKESLQSLQVSFCEKKSLEQFLKKVRVKSM